jgi:hypothetical protein
VVAFTGVGHADELLLQRTLESLGKLLERDAQDGAQVVQLDEIQSPLPGFILADDGLRTTKRIGYIRLTKLFLLAHMSEKGEQRLLFLSAYPQPWSAFIHSPKA